MDFDPRYALGEKLGRGGMAGVWAAVGAADGAEVAVKWLHPELVAREELRTRFLREQAC